MHFIKIILQCRSEAFDIFIQRIVENNIDRQAIFKLSTGLLAVCDANADSFCQGNIARLRELFSIQPNYALQKKLAKQRHFFSSPKNPIDALITKIESLHEAKNPSHKGERKTP